MEITRIIKDTGEILNGFFADELPVEEGYYFKEGFCPGGFTKPFYNFDTDQYYEGATAEEIHASDPKNHPDYYLVRADAGQKLVNEITNKLLFDYKTGVRSLQDTMTIESKLDNVIASLNFGQLITAKFKISQVTGIDSTLMSEIISSINSLVTAHYPQ